MAKTMMTVAAGLLAAAPLAAGLVNVVNNCADSVTLWTIGDIITGPLTIVSGDTYGETPDAGASTRWIDIAQSADALMYHKPQTTLSYSLDGAGQIHYALTDMFGDAFEGSSVVLEASDASCPTVEWTSGTPTEETAADNVCSADADITLTLCA